MDKEQPSTLSDVNKPALNQHAADILSVYAEHSSSPIKRCLVIGDSDLALDLHDYGLHVDYIPDADFFKSSDLDDDPRFYLGRMKQNGINNPGAWTSFYNAVGRFKGYAAADAVSLIDTWDLIVADTNDAWVHPSWWSKTAEYRGDSYKDIDALCDLFEPGGMLLFRSVSKPIGDRQPLLWREDWDDFLTSRFTPLFEASIGGVMLLGTCRI
jgi:hypothetical protein